MKLRITWDGGSTTFNPDDTIRVGRVPESTITVPDDVVSRAHVLITHVGSLWTFEDLSSNGTYIDGERVSVGGLGGPVDMHLGTATGPRIRLEPLVESAPAWTPSDPTLPTSIADVSSLVPPPPPASPSSDQPSVTPPAPAPPSAPSASPPSATPPPPPADAAAPPSPASPATLATPGTSTLRLDDRQLRLELEGRVHTFTPGHRVTVGRDPGCDVHTDSQLVSALHCVFTHDGGRWWIEDSDSTRGTFIDHKEVQRQPIEGAFFVLLGDDDAGEPLRVITAGVHRKPQDRRPLFLAGAALAIALFGGLAAWYFWPDQTANEAVIAELREQVAEQQRMSEEQLAAQEERAQQAIDEANSRGGAGNSPTELMRARLSTARIEVPGPDGDIIGTGSGALVSDDGLILTNIHVARPELEFERTGDPTFSGLEDPEQLLVAFPSEDGGPANMFFVAEQFSAHPSHDAALIRIVEPMEGASLDDLPDPLPVGESTNLRAGDQIAVVGYPGTAFTERVSVALSNFQSFQPCFVGSSFDEGWGCLRDYDEGYLNLAGETLEGGSSGGPILHKGEIVGIQLGVFGRPGASSAQNLGVPMDLISEELDLG